eukprot:5397503-Pyramimonas_sp.AAC.1
MCRRVSRAVWGSGGAVHEIILSGLLSNQFVHTPLLEDRHWRVVSGAGMGFPCAGDVADVNFAEMVEVELMSRFEDHGLLFYGRFRDDILLL